MHQILVGHITKLLCDRRPGLGRSDLSVHVAVSPQRLAWDDRQVSRMCVTEGGPWLQTFAAPSSEDAGVVVLDMAMIQTALTHSILADRLSKDLPLAQ